MFFVTDIIDISESLLFVQTRDLVRSRTIDCHAPTVPSAETTPMLQRTPSRQTIAIVGLHKHSFISFFVSFFQHPQMVPDPMDQAEVDTTGSSFLAILDTVSFDFVF